MLQLSLLAAALLLLPMLARDPSAESARSQNKLFSPTQAPPNARYVGSKTCANCHEQQAAGHNANAMTLALELPPEYGVLRQYPSLSLKRGKYRYTVERKGNESIYSVTDGQQTISVPVAWAFGASKMGQTFVLRHQGQFYESRVSFYQSIKGLDLTMGVPAGSEPRTIEEALGRVMQSVDTKDCFGCHATAAVSEAKLQLDKMTPGITCEACHGPGADHVALAKTGKLKTAADRQIFNPDSLSAYDLSQQYCGACHRSWEQVSLMGLRGIGNVRFQPYRITYSPCYDPEDRRISCTACHNPHQPLSHDVASYDAKCLACHQTTGTVTNATLTKAKACKTGKANCASCHMPRYEIPGSHFEFTDHMIRVVKPGESYPN